MPLKRCREEEDTTVTGKMTFKRFRGDGDAAARYVKQWREEKEKEKVSTLNKTDAVTRPMTFLGEEIELLTRAPVAQIASAAPVRPITQTAPVAPVRPIAQIAPVEPVRPIEEIAPVESVRPIEEIVPIAAVGQITSSRQMFECKTCGREFPKFQALGGHCASHTKSELMNSDNNGRYREHECSICGEKFSIGQALGGHMRRHRKITVGTATLQPGFLGIRESVALPMSGGQGEITALSDTSYESFAFDSNRPIDNVVAERQELQDDRPFYKFL